MTTKFSQLLEDDGAVSPVIGVILMVAITVILAAVIGTFVLGLGDQVSQTAPQASINVESVDAAADTIEFKHGGGDPIDAADTKLKAASGGSSFTLTDGSGTLTTADTFTLTTSGPSTSGAWSGWTSSGSSIDFASGDTVTVTFIDEPSGQIIVEKSVTA